MKRKVTSYYDKKDKICLYKCFQKSEVNMKRKNREKAILIIKCIIFAICSGVLTMLVHMICSRYILHVHGKPAFFSNQLIIYSAFEKFLVAIVYVILGYKLPVKRPVLRAVIYMGIIWASNFLPQIMGLAFADGPIAQQVFVISDIICDSLVYLLAGIVLGMLFGKLSVLSICPVKKGSFYKTVIMSSIVFPILVMVVDQMIEAVYPAFSSRTAMQVSLQMRIPFYINFYCWFILSGVLISVFYRFTEYNENGSGSWFKFALIYGLLIWTPVVMIMILFGTELVTTTVYALLFLLHIIFLVWINSRLLEHDK